jgi:hypothetical protein
MLLDNGLARKRSPVFDDGRGLKHGDQVGRDDCAAFARLR